MISGARSPRAHISPTTVITVVLGGVLLLFLVRAFMSANSERPAAMLPVAIVAAPPPAPPPPPEARKEEPVPQAVTQVESAQWNQGEASEGPPGPPGPPGLPSDGVLGLAEAGEAGGDAFGLAGKPGGHELLLTAVGNGGGGGANPARFTQFATRLEAHLQKGLNEFEALRQDCYTAKVLVWVSTVGIIEKVRITRSTGQPALDAQVRDALESLPPMDVSPPSDMPWPAGLLLVARRADCQNSGQARPR